MLIEAALLPSSLSCMSVRTLGFHFITIPVPVPLRQTVTVPMVPVLAPQH
jgi:hypothetical protein